MTGSAVEHSPTVELAPVPAGVDDAGSAPIPAPALSPVARVLRSAVRLYQQLRFGRLSPCRFHPSCSAYAVEALEVHGAVRGSWLTARRLGRCHPWGGHGIDLVPPARPSRCAGVDPPPGVAPADRKAS